MMCVEEPSTVSGTYQMLSHPWFRSSSPSFCFNGGSSRWGSFQGGEEHNQDLQVGAMGGKNEMRIPKGCCIETHTEFQGLWKMCVVAWGLLKVMDVWRMWVMSSGK